MPAMWLDVDAALAEVPVNLVALIDDTNFKSREESVTYDQVGMDLVWNFVTSAGAYTQTAVTPTTAGDYDWANQGNGMYSIEIPASGGASINNDIEGYGWFTGYATGILPWTGPVIGFRAAGLNNLLCDSAYSTTRGLAGTALPDAAADGVLGLPISDAGGLDMDSLPKSLDRNADLVESQRGSHTWQGNYYYVDPVNGDTHANGNRGGRADPYKTIQDCHDNAVTDNNHDVIFLVSGAASGATTHTVAAITTISKNYVFIRGPGRNFIVTRTGSGDTIAVTGDGFEIAGARIGTAATGSGDGIDITDADFANIHHCWFLDTQGDGVHILRGSNCLIHDNDFDGTGVAGSGDGIHIVGTAGSSNGNSIFNNEMHGTVGDAILIEQGTTNDTLIYGNDIHDAGGWGINIGASSTRAVVYDNVLGNNSSGDITDSGTNSIIKRNPAVDANNRVDLGSWLGTAVTVSSTTAKPEMDVFSISDDATAANNLEAILDGTGEVTLTLEAIVINNSSGVGITVDGSTNGMVVTGANGDGVQFTSSGGNGDGMTLAGNGSGEGLKSTGGATGAGGHFLGGATSGHGLWNQAQTSGDGVSAHGAGTGGDGIAALGGSVAAHGIYAYGGTVAGNGIHCQAQAGNGNGLDCSKHGTGKDINADVLNDWLNGGRLDLLLDAIPTTAMRGTDNGALAATALSDATWTDARAGYLDAINGHTAQTGDSFARIGAAGAGLTDLGGMSDGMKAEVNTEVVDTLDTDTYVEPGQGAPGATVSLTDKIGYLYKNWRNKKMQDATTWELYSDDAATVDQKATVSDDATDFTKGEVATGP